MNIMQTNDGNKNGVNTENPVINKDDVRNKDGVSSEHNVQAPVNSADKVSEVAYGDVVLQYVDESSNNKQVSKEIGKQTGKLLMYVMLGFLLVILVPLVVGFYRGVTGVDSSIFDFNALTELFNRAADKLSS